MKSPITLEELERLSNNITTVLFTCKEPICKHHCPEPPFPHKTQTLGLANLTESQFLNFVIVFLECVCKFVATLHCLIVAKTSACLFLGAQLKQEFLSATSITKQARQKNYMVAYVLLEANGHPAGCPSMLCHIMSQ